MPDIKTIADRADMIVNGYAFERRTDGIHVLNLNHPDKASVFNSEDETIETTMDDIEISIVRKYLIANRIYMED
ncbi:MAG: hypothetical protein KBT29_11665 [Prevotellaceae bacterium]|nr:hypothetical protein [Candidatus Minthosoma caballi]